ncbi:hypothetical protein ACIOEX_16370 [Streptomyces sp. NPDC087850]|uniref:hypothetical protein n=1 Tax=Streptomyces sp. NPDC087850 TaxID=3365809 RepID=UPI0037F78DFB
MPPERPGPQCYHGEGDHNGDRLGVLPGDREILVEWLLHEVADCAVHDERGGAWWPPPLAESGGPAGPSPRRALAYGLGARHPQDRLASVDALLAPAARGEPAGPVVGEEPAGPVVGEEPAGPVVGEEPAGPVVSDEVKVDRPADSVRTAAATGAYATVRSVPSAALPALLPTGAGRRPSGPGSGSRRRWPPTARSAVARPGRYPACRSRPGAAVHHGRWRRPFGCRRRCADGLWSRCADGCGARRMPGTTGAGQVALTRRTFHAKSDRKWLKIEQNYP